MGIDAKGLVLMSRENGILTHELGSYQVNDGLSLIFKAYVEDKKVKLFVTTENDVTDDEYNEIFDLYETEAFEEEGIQVQEVEDEFNPVWDLIFDYSDEHTDNEETINFALEQHKKQLDRIFETLRT